LTQATFDFALAAYDSGGCVVAAPHKCPLSQGYRKNHAANLAGQQPHSWQPVVREGGAAGYS
jgi:hypothetical protein